MSRLTNHLDLAIHDFFQELEDIRLYTETSLIDFECALDDDTEGLGEMFLAWRESEYGYDD